MLDSNTVQSIASPTEWQNVTSALKEKGVTFASSVTKVTKRIRCQRMEGADPLNQDLIRIRFGCPGAEAAIAVQWEPTEGDPGLVTFEQVKVAIQSYGIRDIGWDPKWQRVRTQSGRTAYRWTWDIDIPAQGEDEVSLIYDIIENGTEIACGNAVGALVFMGAPCGDGSWMVHQRKLFPEKMEHQLTAEAIRMDPRVSPQHELVTLRHPVITSLVPRQKLPSNAKLEEPIATEVSIAPPILPHVKQEDLLNGRHAYIPLGIRLPCYLNAPREEDIHIYSIHPVHISQSDIDFQGTLRDRKLAAKGVKKIAKTSRFEKMVSNLVSRYTDLPVKWETYRIMEQMITHGTLVERMTRDEDVKGVFNNASLITVIMPKGFSVIVDEIAMDNEGSHEKRFGSFYSDLAFKVKNVCSMALFATVSAMNQRKIGIRNDDRARDAPSELIIMIGKTASSERIPQAQANNQRTTATQQKARPRPAANGGKVGPNTGCQAAGDKRDGRNGVTEDKLEKQRQDTLRANLDKEASTRKRIEEMHGVYHERQRAAKCGIHVLNNILQGIYFDEGTMDAAWERYKNKGIEENVPVQKRQHMTSSGDYSIEIITTALAHPSARKNGNNKAYSITWLGAQSDTESIIKWTMGVEEGVIGVIINTKPGTDKRHYVGVRPYGQELPWMDSLHRTPQVIDCATFHSKTKGCILFLVKEWVPLQSKDTHQHGMNFVEETDSHMDDGDNQDEDEQGTGGDDQLMPQSGIPIGPHGTKDPNDQLMTSPVAEVVGRDISETAPTHSKAQRSDLPIAPFPRLNSSLPVARGKLEDPQYP